MSKDTESFGTSIGGYRPVEHDEVPIDLSHTGLNFERGLKQVPETEAAIINRIRTLRGGIAPEFAMFNFPPEDIGMFNPIMHIASLEHLTQKLVVRMTYNKWQWFNGSAWLDIPGSIAGLAGQRMYSTIMDDKLIVANGATRLLAWDGSPINAAADLSAEAPAAKFVTRVGNRLLAANLKFILANDLNPHEVAWSADNNIGEWTDVLAGAGDAIIKPEGSPTAANYITGLSNLERGTVLYRQRSLMLISRTGIRAAPFRFATIDFSKGTESPYSIASGGLALGDFFLGFDYVVYHFDGQNPPVPVGMPIQRKLRRSIPDLSQIVGFIDPLRMEYILLCPREGQIPTILPDAYIFDLRAYINDQKLSWRYRDLDPLPITTAAHIPRVATVFVPFVDSLNQLVDRVDPTDEPTFVTAVTATYGAQPPPPPPEPIPSEFRSSYGSFGLAVSLWGFNKDSAGNFTTPKCPTPDMNTSNTNGTTLVQRGGLLDQAKAVGARISFRVQSGNQTQMVNYPTDRTFDITKWKAGVGSWIDEVEAVSGGVARLRLAVQERTWNWLYAFDDYISSNTGGNSFLKALTYEQLEECCHYVKVVRNMPWMPCVGRGKNSYNRIAAAASGTVGSPFRNEISRNAQGVRQYKYYDCGWGQWAPKIEAGHGFANPLQYFTREVNDGIACGLGVVAGINLQRGLGTTPGWGCPYSGYGTVGVDCGCSPTEIADTIDAIKGFPSIYGFYVYSYNAALEYWSLPAIQSVLYDGFDYMITRPEGKLNIRGTSGAWYGDINGGLGP